MDGDDRGDNADEVPKAAVEDLGQKGSEEADPFRREVEEGSADDEKIDDNGAAPPALPLEEGKAGADCHDEVGQRQPDEHGGVIVEVTDEPDDAVHDENQ